MEECSKSHSHHTQKADLTRLCHTLMHVDNLHWIVENFTCDTFLSKVVNVITYQMNTAA